MPDRVDSAVRKLVTAGNVVVGQFRCAPEAPNFSRAGAITRHCFVVPRRGVWIQHEGEAPFVADPTRITLYNPGQPYERRALDPAGDRSDWITVSDAVAREIVATHHPAAADSPNRVFQFPYAPARPDLYLALRRLHEYVRAHPHPDLLLVEESAVTLLAGVVGSLYEHVSGARPAPPAMTRRNRDAVEDARAHLNATFNTNEGLGAIALAVGTSVFHLCRIFRRASGLTLHAYRHQLRLRSALEPLERPDTDLLALALDLGYSGHSHFTAAFRRQFGIAPSRLRGRLGVLDGSAPASPLPHVLQ